MFEEEKNMLLLHDFPTIIPAINDIYHGWSHELSLRETKLRNAI